METTTIQVRKDQAAALREIQRQNGNYKTAIDQLLESYNETTSTQETAIDTEELAREVARQLDYAEISTLVANEVEALRR